MFSFSSMRFSFVFFAVLTLLFSRISLTAVEQQSRETDLTKELRDAAKKSGGIFLPDLTESTAETIGLQVAAHTGKMSLITFGREKVSPGNFTVKSLWIDSECTGCRIGIQGNCEDLQLMLWTPQGVYIDRSIPEKHIRKSTFERTVFYDITAPAHGIWGIGVQCRKTVSKQTALNFYALGRTRIRLDVSSEIVKQDGKCSLSIKCNIPRWSGKIHDTQIVAQIRLPQGNIRRVELFPAKDGLFHTEVPCNQPGKYTCCCYLKAFTSRKDALYRQTFPFSSDIPAGAIKQKRTEHD